LTFGRSGAQYGAKPFEQQQFGTAGVEGVNGQMIGHILINLNQIYFD